MKTEFYLRRIHSLLGIAPMYLFLAMHIPHTAMPFLTLNFTEHPWPIMIIMGIIPFGLHALIGIYILIKNKKSGKDLSNKSTRKKGTLYKFQIASGIVLLLFVLSHAVVFKLLRYSEGYTVYIIAVAIFMLGIPALAFHIGYGTYTFCLTWGLCANSTVRKIIRVVCTALGIVFWIAVTVLFVLVFISIKGMLGL